MASRAPVIAPVWLALSLPLAVAVGSASAAGVLVPATYMKETASWSSQAVGQDFATLFVVLPMFALSAILAYRGSVRAFMVWQGLLLYFVYSYVLYAFFVHFGPWFLVYVAALGLSFHALAASVLTCDISSIAQRWQARRDPRPMSILLALVGVSVAILWLTDVVTAMRHGTVPAGLTDIGLPVNPIHVLDLAVLLPAFVFTAILLWRRSAYGFAFAIPMATFAVAMSSAIVAMALVMRARAG